MKSEAIKEFKQETRSENSIVGYVKYENKYSGIDVSKFITYYLGQDNCNTTMYLSILKIDTILAYEFLVNYGELLYIGNDFKDAMKARK